jgi:hypothetical protein
MSYVIVLTAMALGVVGVIFTRRNQFNLLQPHSQVLIWLIIVVGIAGIIDIAYKDDAIRNANRRVQLVEARLQSLALKSFDLARPPAAARFVIEAEDSGQPLQLANFSGPFPSYGRKGRLGKISVALPDVFASHADIAIEPDGSVHLTHTDAEGRALREGEPGPWFRPSSTQPLAHGSDLRAQMPLARILSALKANGRNVLGTLELDIPNTPQTRTYVAVNFERILAAFKFYVRQETPYEPCAAVILVPLRFEIEPPQNDTRMQLTLRMIEREALSVECADKLPF